MWALVLRSFMTLLTEVNYVIAILLAVVSLRAPLVIRTPSIPLDPFRVCLYDHNRTLAIGIAFEVAVLTLGMFLFDIWAPLMTFVQTRSLSFRW